MVGTTKYGRPCQTTTNRNEKTMPKFKGGFGIDDPDEAINSEFDGDASVGYTGPCPPSGPYHGILKRLELTKTGPDSKVPGTPMLKILVEIQEKGEKAKYNGYGIWNNQMVTKKSAVYANQFLDALAGGNEAKAKAIKTWFWKEQIQTEEPEGGHILAIGKLKVNSPDASIPVIFNTKKVQDYQDAEKMKLEVKRWLVPNKDDNTAANDDLDGGTDEDLDEGLDDIGGDEFGDDPSF